QVRRHEPHHGARATSRKFTSPHQSPPYNSCHPSCASATRLPSPLRRPRRRADHPFGFTQATSMCGIVGYVGPRAAEPVLLEGLRRLEYRGYDSSGIATLNGDLHVRKKAGRLGELTAHLLQEPAPGGVGIGHVRWATHGGPSDRNAHPHVAGANGRRVAVVHNGVIENFSALKRRLLDDGAVFESDTDTEVIAHLIARHLESDLATAGAAVLPLLKGTYGLAVVSTAQPGVIVGARLGSPLAIGVGDGETFLASDQVALAGQARQAAFLSDGQICVLSADGWRLFDRDRAS